MIRVVGEPVGRIGHDHVRLVLVHQRFQPPDDRRAIEPAERARIDVVRGPVHAGVGVVQWDEIADAQRQLGHRQLVGAPSGHLLRLMVTVTRFATVGVVTLPAVGAGDENRAKPLVRVSRKGAAGLARFVVRVRVNDHQRRPDLRCVQ